MQETGIIWSEVTWNPMSGCVKVSDGCKYCYAEAFAERKRGTPGFVNGFDLTLRPHKLREPLRLKQPTLIFVNSMSDLFWEQIPQAYRDQVVDVMEATPQHQYQVLTKRPEAMVEYSNYRKLPDNFWAGTSIENWKSMHRLETLKKVKASLHFISAEPLLSPLDIMPEWLYGIDWVITGGESGQHLWRGDIAEKRSLARYNSTLKKWEPREDRMQWVRDIRDACALSETKFFHKQWGGNTPEAAGRLLDGQFYSEMPRLPGNNTTHNNTYLKLLEGKK